jgi:hypothetical protein
MVQGGGSEFPVGRGNLLEPLILLVLVVCAGALFLPVLALLVARVRTAARSRRSRRRRLRAAANAERRARALMSELCPHGWRAQITLIEGSVGQPHGDAEAEPDRVALDWTEFGDDSGRPAVMRRVWAPSIGEALDAMVADRRTDETLERIEQGAAADGALWSDL